MPLMILLWLQLQVTPTFQLGCSQSIKNWNIAWPAESKTLPQNWCQYSKDYVFKPPFGTPIASAFTYMHCLRSPMLF